MLTDAIMRFTQVAVERRVWVAGRSIAVKKRFFQYIADEIHAKQGVRKQDIWISLLESGREDWSFGNGEMQYAPEEGS